MKKVLVMLLALTLVFAFAATALAAPVTATVPADTSAKLLGGTTDTLTVAYSSTTYKAPTAGYYRLAVTSGGTTTNSTSTDSLAQDAQITGLSVSSINFATTGKKTVSWEIQFSATGADGSYAKVTASGYSGTINAYVGTDGNTLTVGALTVTPAGTGSITSSGNTFSLHVPKLTNKISIAFSNASANATITASEHVSVNPDTGAALFNGTIETTTISNFSVYVAPQNGESATTYTFKIYKDYDTPVLNSFKLGSSTISIGADFKGTASYDAPADDGYLEISGTFTGSHVGAASGNYDDDVTFNGGNYTYQSNGSIEDGTFSGKIRLGSGGSWGNTITVKVKVMALDGTTDQEYTFTLTKSAALVPLNFSASSSMSPTLSGGSSNKGSGTIYVGTNNPIYVRTTSTTALKDLTIETGTATHTGNAATAAAPEGAAANKIYKITLNDDTSKNKLYITVDGVQQTYTLDRSAALTGTAYSSKSTSATYDLDFDFTSSRKTDSITLTSSWGSKVWLQFNQNVGEVEYKNDSQTSKKEISEKDDFYEVPVDGTTYVYIDDTYTLTINPDSAAFTVKVCEAAKSSSDYESVDFPSSKANKSVKVNEDWDDGNVYLKFPSNSEVKNVEYGYNTTQSKAKDADDEGSYWEIPLDGTTYVWFTYDGVKDYRLEIKPDGTAGTDSLIDSVEATSKDDGKGDEYLAFYGSDKIYVFRPNGSSGSTYLNIESDEKVYHEDDDDENVEGDWVPVSAGDIFTIDDEEFEVVIYTASKNDDDDAALSALSLKAGTKSSSLSSVSLSPDFKSGTKSYSAGIGSDATYARISAKLSDSNAYMIIEGYDLYSTSSSKDWNISGLSTKTNSFKYTVHVIAEDCEEHESYTITMNRSGDSALKSLTVSGGYLTPAFSGKITSYTSYTSASSTTIGAYAENSKPTVAINGYSAGSLGSQTGTGSAYGTFNLAEGLNTFVITVKSGSNTTLYYVSVYRIPASPRIQVSNQNISINGTNYTLAAYNINGNNFVKLRDLAALLMNTSKKFSLDFSDSTQTATMAMGGNYVKRGDELSALPAYRKYTASSQRFILDGSAIYPMAFNIDGTNYVMVRDMGSAMDFSVTYTASTKTINVNTNGGYVPN